MTNAKFSRLCCALFALCWTAACIGGGCAIYKIVMLVGAK